MTSGQFHREISFIDATAIVVGSMIGSGIFIVSAESSRYLGSPGWLLVAWLIAGFLTVVGALCYGEMSSMFPHAGGQYVFLREAYGKLPAFLYGWTLFLVIQSGTNAAVSVGFAKFLGVFVPWVASTNLIVSLPLTASMAFNLSTQQLVAVSVIALLTAVNCQGVTTAKLVQTTFTATKVVALFALILLGIFATSKHTGAVVNFSNMWQAVDINGSPLTGLAFMSALAVAMVGPLFSSDAWNNVTFAGEEVKNPERTLPLSLVSGTALVCVMYLLTNFIYLLLLPLHGDPHGSTIVARGIQYAAEDRVGTAAAEVIFGDSGKQIMSFAIMISTFGALNGLILSGPRAYYAMARDGLFFKRAGVLDAKTGVPTFGLIIQGLWSGFLTLTGTYSNLLEYIISAALIFYIMAIGALFVFRKTKKDLARPYKVPLYPLLPICYILIAGAVIVGQVAMSPSHAGAGLLIIFSGLPAYLIWAKLGKKEKAPKKRLISS